MVLLVPELFVSSGLQGALTIGQLFPVDGKLVPDDEGLGLLAEWRKCNDYES